MSESVRVSGKRPIQTDEMDLNYFHNFMCLRKVTFPSLLQIFFPTALEPQPSTKATPHTLSFHHKTTVLNGAK